MEVINVLLVDDDPNRTAPFRRILLREGFQKTIGGTKVNVIEALDAEDAMTQLQTTKFQLVVTDLRMPHTIGHKVAIAASKDPNCVVILNSDIGKDGAEIKKFIGSESENIPSTVQIKAKQEVTLDFIQELIKRLVSATRQTLEANLQRSSPEDFNFRLPSPPKS